MKVTMMMMNVMVFCWQQLHFTSQQQISQHLEQQEEEYDDEEPLITPATSNTIVVEAEDLELDESCGFEGEGRN